MDYGLEGFYCEASTIEKTIASQEYLNPRGGSEQLPYYKTFWKPTWVHPSVPVHGPTYFSRQIPMK